MVFADEENVVSPLGAEQVLYFLWEGNLAFGRDPSLSEMRYWHETLMKGSPYVTVQGCTEVRKG